MSEWIDEYPLLLVVPELIVLLLLLVFIVLRSGTARKSASGKRARRTRGDPD